MSATTVVLVHGVVTGAWSWQPVIEHLDAHGCRAVAVDLPSRGPTRNGLGDLHDDADTVRRLVEDQRGPVVLCGHSYGGAVITEAAAGCRNVEHLVYVAALMPDVNETAAELFLGALDTSVEPPFMFGSDGTLSFNLAGAPVHLADCEPEMLAWAAPQLAVQSMVSLAQVPSAAAWRELPSTYVIASRDTIVPPPLQRRLAERAKATVEIDAGHMVPFSRPADLAETLAAVAGTCA